MSKFQHDVMLRVVKILDVLMIELPFAACWLLYYSEQVYAKFAWKGNLAILALFFVLYITLGKVYDAFWMSMQRISEPDGGEALQPLARHRSHCRAACDGGCLGVLCARMVLPDVPATADSHHLR